MLKILGMVFIVAGSAGMGAYYSDRLKRHLAQLVESREIFAQLEAGREYLRLPYAQLLRKTARGKSELFGGALCEVADEMEKNRENDAGALWAASLSKRERQLLLSEEEQELFLALANSLMSEGNPAKAVKLYEAQLEGCIRRTMEEKKEKQKLYGTASVLCGLFLVILLL